MAIEVDGTMGPLYRDNNNNVGEMDEVDVFYLSFVLRNVSKKDIFTCDTFDRCAEFSFLLFIYMHHRRTYWLCVVSIVSFSFNCFDFRTMRVTNDI